MNFQLDDFSRFSSLCVYSKPFPLCNMLVNSTENKIRKHKPPNAFKGTENQVYWYVEKRHLTLYNFLLVNLDDSEGFGKKWN